MTDTSDLTKKFNLSWNDQLATDLDWLRPRNIPLSTHVRMVLEKYFEVKEKGRRRIEDKITTNLTDKQQKIKFQHEGELNDRIQLRISPSLIDQIKQESQKRRMNQSQLIRLILSNWVIEQVV